MKIAAIHNFLTAWGGAERSFIEMMKALKHRGHEIHVYALKINDEFSRTLVKEGIIVTSFDIKDPDLIVSNKRPFIRLQTKLRVLMLFQKLSGKLNSDYDLVFVHHQNYSPLVMPFIRNKCVYYCPEPPRWYYEPKVKFREPSIKDYPKEAIKSLFCFVEKHLDRFCVKYANLILTNSDYGREYVWKTYCVFPVTNYLGVDTAVFIKKDIKKENFVLSVGRIQPLKGHDFVIKSVGLIPEEMRPRVVIAGEGLSLFKEKIRDTAIKNGVALEIKDNLSEKDLVELYNKAAVTAAGFVMEPFGLVVLESMACETPVVAVREGGLRESVTNETGILTERNEKEFAKAIEYLLDNPEKSKKMGVAGRKRVEEHFTWGKCAINLERHFIEMR